MSTAYTFRFWCREKWYEHIDEIISIGGTEPTYTSQQYFNKYRWWLKREYQFQQKNNLL